AAAGVVRVAAGPGQPAVADVMLEESRRPAVAGRTPWPGPGEVHDGPLGATLQPPTRRGPDRWTTPRTGNRRSPGRAPRATPPVPRAGRRGRPRRDRSAQRRRPGPGRRRVARRDDLRGGGCPPLADDPRPGPGPDCPLPLDRAEGLRRRPRSRSDRGEDRLSP